MDSDWVAIGSIAGIGLPIIIYIGIKLFVVIIDIVSTFTDKE